MSCSLLPAACCLSALIAAPAQPPAFHLPAARDAGRRVEASLAGLWEGALFEEPAVRKRAPLRGRTEPVRTAPEVARWSEVRVPGGVPPRDASTSFAHLMLFRTRIDVPAAFEGRSFVLRIPSFNMIASVIVNGTYCGFSKAPYAIWDCDVTRAIETGARNEIVVAVKDVWYALSAADENAWIFSIPARLIQEHSQGPGMKFDFPVFTRPESGILEPPVLTAAGPVYTADVFAMPSVRRKELALEATLFNPGVKSMAVSVDNEVRPLGGGAVERAFPRREIAVAAGERKVLHLAAAWKSPRIWWPDDPRQYEIVTTISARGKPIDVTTTKFGFRQWEWNGVELKLNGVPWHLRADLCSGSDPEEALRTMKGHGQNMWRFWGSRWCGLGQEATLDFMDRHGMLVRRSGVFDGEFASYNWWSDPAQGRRLWDNFRAALEAQVRGERNHPSIFIWSMENEITFINSRNLGKLSTSDPEIRKAAAQVTALDPTRPVMVDGGNCLLDGSLPVNGVHYVDAPWRGLPDAAYTTNWLHATRTPWKVIKGRPILLGEAFFARGKPASAYAQICGEKAFLGRPEAREAVGLLVKMYSEGYRWCHVSPHFWLYEGEQPYHRTSWQPVAALVRQWDRVFEGGSKIRRTVRLFNDTRHASPITFLWKAAGTAEPRDAIDEGRQTFEIEPGGSRDLTVEFTAPEVAERTEASLELTCRREDKEVFRDRKELVFLPSAPPPPPQIAGKLAVVDPEGPARMRLEARGVTLREVRKLEEIPTDARVVVVGRNALAADPAQGVQLRRLAARGARILVLEQEHVLAEPALPGTKASGVAGRIAFAQSIDHPVFRGLQQADLSMWSRGHVVYRRPYSKLPAGAKALVQCDEELGLTALAACPVERGLLVLCQMAVGEKLAFDAAARRLFDNLVDYCSSYELVERTCLVRMPPADPRSKLLEAVGLTFDAAAAPGDVLHALKAGTHGIVITDASADSLRRLASDPGVVRRFTARGGWLLLWGLEPGGLSAFNRVVGVHHLLRPFEMERVTLPPRRDLVMAGITARDVSMRGEKIYAWAGDRFAAGDVFTYVVDTDDIAPFCRFPDPAGYFKMEDPKPGMDHWPRNIVNGFTTSNSWKYVLSINFEKKQPTRLPLTLPRAEEITSFSVVFNAIYHKVTRFRLTFDGKSDEALTLAARPGNERQDYPIDPPRKASSVAIELLEWTREARAPVVGIDNIWLRVKRSAAFHRKVVPLVVPAGLVKYPEGKGGIILCELRVTGKVESPNESKKRAILARMLGNLGAVFRQAGIAR